MNIRNVVYTKAIEVNIQSTGVAEEEFLYIIPKGNPTKQQLWEENETVRKTAKKETLNDSRNEVSKILYFHRPTAGTIDYGEGRFKDNAKIR